jgi:predicted acyl esterase
MVQTGTDIPAKWEEPKDHYDYVKRDVMIPMRDGVKLHTVIIIPKNARGLPMLLERTPYDATFDARTDAPHLRDAVWSALREWVDDGYIFVSQDIRGKYGSQGKYVMTRPVIGPLNPTKTDDTTDAYDTIEWLTKNVPESNQRVGMIGSSYDGWTVTMALLAPHPALKVAAPESPMIDGWMGDDWFHYGAFRQVNLDYFTEQTSKTGEGAPSPAPMPMIIRLSSTRERRATGPTRTASSNSASGTACPPIRPMTPSGRVRRWTRKWSSVLPPCPPCGFRACGIRRTCMVRCTAMKR